MQSRNSRILLLVCVLVIFAASYIASRVQTAGGDIQLQEIKVPAQNGQWVAGDLFRPRTATEENPAPLIVVVPGFQRSKEALANIAIELARRRWRRGLQRFMPSRSIRISIGCCWRGILAGM